MISLKGKVRNLTSSNLVAVEYLISCWLVNPNINHLLMTGQLLFFLWENFSQRGPIPKFNPLLKTVCVFGGKWGAHSYSDALNYNKITNNFLNQIPLLVLTCWKYDEKLNVGFENIIDVRSFALIVDSHWHVLFLTYWPTNIKWRSVMLQKSITLILFFPMLV